MVTVLDPVPDLVPTMAAVHKNWFGGDNANAAEISGDWVKIKADDDWCIVSGPSPVPS